MPQNVAHAFLRAVSPFVATSLGTGILGGPGLLRLCSGGWNTQAKARPNRFAAPMKGSTVAVVLDPDVASVF